jgi:hypothetical protein
VSDHHAFESVGCNDHSEETAECCICQHSCDETGSPRGLVAPVLALTSAGMERAVLPTADDRDGTFRNVNPSLPTTAVLLSVGQHGLPLKGGCQPGDAEGQSCQTLNMHTRQTMTSALDAAR